ncbi:serine/threonine protein kinase [Bacillus sp. VT 712]|uniref:Serine/threonine protein kinase n=1 Tax=Priestia veravalensis TaxID=1414648 RepID=A0A0V8JID1_9BACI|nr:MULTISPECIES: hypothetical protein [Bacillaceae]KSU86798.1 serine/threonine protein kinase [Priestia veravalensis]KZB90179.1 serine/threonine protein kinase [Bacillus sp. VT 712]SCC48002.1 hypothetical protein GA0061087_105520 [Priestia flexa]
MDKLPNQFIELIETSLLPNLIIKSENEHDPVIVEYVPGEWILIGKGNYAAVFYHPLYEGLVVKVYGRSFEEVKKEANVYKKLGKHPAYSQLYYYTDHYLILKRLQGITLYEAVQKRVIIPLTVIDDVNDALAYAKSRGLNPFDVHGKNVMMKEGRGYVVDISDFYKKGIDKKWTDLVKAYHKIYVPIIKKYHLAISPSLLNLTRHVYRLYRKVKNKYKKYV